MTRELTVALVGIGGYGETYLSTLLHPPMDAQFRFAAAVDPFAKTARRSAEIVAQNVPIFESLAAMYAEVKPDLVILASPIQFHAEQITTALKHGSHVLSEKPLAATVEQCREVQRVRDEAGRLVAVGFQWSFCPVIHSIKRDIQAGRFGRPKQFKTMALWPRDERYYSRNRWAGRKYDDQGRPVFDSPANNACAHYLHNMFYMLGSEPGTSASLADVTAELYRAKNIDNYDTAAMRCVTRDGVPLLFIVSHATKSFQGPVLHYEFEDATIHFSDGAGEEFVARFKNGKEHSYGAPSPSNNPTKLLRTLHDIRENTPTLCSVEAAIPHAEAVARAAAVTEIVTIPRQYLHTIGEVGSRLTYVEGIDAVFKTCYDQGRLPSEVNCPWAVPSAAAV
ncbi:MAG: Gfo/Idh/MocA family protein [Tepidisphaeraceae bacterium]